MEVGSGGGGIEAKDTEGLSTGMFPGLKAP